MLAHRDQGVGRLPRIICLASALAIALATSPTAISAAAGGVPTFDAPFLSFNTGGAPYRIAAGDLNGDGRADLAVSLLGSTPAADVLVFLSRADGSFQRPVSYPMVAKGVALGDLDGDGRLDLVAAGDGVAVFRGLGDGTFGPAILSGSGTSCNTIVLADMNHDGHLDVVAHTAGIAILLGNGDGTLQAPRYGAPTFGEEDDIAVGDLDHDGNLDVAVPNTRGLSMHPCHTEWFGHGDGSVGPPVGVGTCGIGHPFTVAIGDLDGDGLDDLSSDSGIADLDGDGRNDIINLGGGSVVVARGLGGGSYAPAVSYPAGPDPRDFAIADVDGDGVLDIAVANKAPCDQFTPPVFCGVATSVSVLFGRGDASFGRGGITIPRPGAVATALGDLDGDGHLDLVSSSSDGFVSAFLGHGDGSFSPRTDATVCASPAAVRIADLDRDGYPDLVTSCSVSGTVTVLLGHGDGTFPTRHDLLAANHVQSVAVGDLDGDGIPDLAIAGDDLRVARGVGDGTFGAPAVVATDFMGGVAIGDLDGDGRSDLMTIPTLFGDAISFLGNGDGTFRPGTQTAISGTSSDVALGDLDRDGRLDAVIALRGSDNPSSETTVLVLRGLGNGGFEPPRSFDVGRGPNRVAIADVDLDGRLDLVTSDEFAATASVLRGHGDMTFDERVGYGSTGSNPAGLSVGDVNGDGRPDLVMANKLSGNVTLLLHRDDGSQPTHTLAIEIHGQGTVTPNPDLATYPQGSTVQLQPSAASGWEFWSWGGDASGNASPLTLLMDADKHVTATFALDIGLELEPRKLNLSEKEMHKRIKGWFEPPLPFDARAIDAASIRLNGVVAVDPTVALEYHDRNHDQSDDLLARFRRGDLMLVLPAGDAVPVVATGQLGGDLFVGRTTVQVKKGKVRHPRASDVVAVGVPVTVSWDVASTAAPSATLLVSYDAGVNWATALEGIPDNGTISWVPAAPADSALLAVVEVEGTDPTGEVSGVLAVSEPLTIGAPVAVGDLPAALALESPWPNPSARPVSLRYALSRRGEARLAIFDLQGRLVRTLVEGAQDPGWREVVWDEKDAAGALTGPGLYFAELSAEGRTLVRRVARVR